MYFDVEKDEEVVQYIVEVIYSYRARFLVVMSWAINLVKALTYKYKLL